MGGGGDVGCGTGTRVCVCVYIFGARRSFFFLASHVRCLHAWISRFFRGCVVKGGVGFFCGSQRLRAAMCAVWIAGFGFDGPLFFRLSKYTVKSTERFVNYIDIYNIDRLYFIFVIKVLFSSAVFPLIIG